MPWEKQFNVDDTLAKAMKVFWARGYDATSMQDLVDVMEINRGSLYATYGDKRALFLQALRRYDETYREKWFAAVSADKPPKEAILAVFDAAVEAAFRPDGQDGCLLVNTALELSPHDDEIAEIVADAFARTQRFFEINIEAGRAAGTISADVEPVEVAGALLSLFLGLRVLARSRPDKKLLRAVARQADAMLA